MASKVRTIRRGLRAALGAIDGLAVYDDWPNNAQMPCAIPELVGVEHEQTLGASTSHDLAIYRFEAVVAVSLAGGLPNAQEQMDEYMSGTGSKSVRAALAADRTLGGACHSLFFGPWNRPSDEEISGQTYYVQRLPVEAWAT